MRDLTVERHHRSSTHHCFKKNDTNNGSKSRRFTSSHRTILLGECFRNLSLGAPADVAFLVQRPTLLTLPPEILLYIFSYIPSYFRNHCLVQRPQAACRALQPYFQRLLYEHITVLQGSRFDQLATTINGNPGIGKLIKKLVISDVLFPPPLSRAGDSNFLPVKARFSEALAKMTRLEELSLERTGQLPEAVLEGPSRRHPDFLPHLVALHLTFNGPDPTDHLDLQRYRHLHRYPSLSHLSLHISDTAANLPISSTPSILLSSIKHLELKGSIKQLASVNFLPSFNQLTSLTLRPETLNDVEELPAILDMVNPDHLASLCVENEEDYWEQEDQILLGTALTRFKKLGHLSLRSLWTDIGLFNALEDLPLETLVLDDGLDMSFEALAGMIRGPKRILTLKSITLDFGLSFDEPPPSLALNKGELFKRSDGTFGIAEEWDGDSPLSDLTWIEASEFVQVAKDAGVEVEGDILYLWERLGEERKCCDKMRRELTASQGFFRRWITGGLNSQSA